MERARQMRRDLITVAVVVVLLGAAMLLISASAAFAQSAAEDQYSSASTSASAAEDQYSPNPPPDSQAQVDALQTILQMANHAASSGAITFSPSTFGSPNLFPGDGTTTFSPSTFGSPNLFPDDSGATTYQPDSFGAGPSGVNALPITIAAGQTAPRYGPNLGVGGGGVPTPAPPMVPFLVT